MLYIQDEVARRLKEKKKKNRPMMSGSPTPFGNLARGEVRRESGDIT